MTAIRVQMREARNAGRCSLCHADDGELLECVACATLTHLECRLEAKKCPTIGCAAWKPVPADDPSFTAIRDAAACTCPIYPDMIAVRGAYEHEPSCPAFREPPQVPLSSPAHVAYDDRVVVRELPIWMRYPVASGLVAAITFSAVASVPYFLVSLSWAVTLDCMLVAAIIAYLVSYIDR